jgi:hypothetical protein
MPSKKHHLEFDEILRGKDVICEDTDGTTVHTRMDKHAKTFGPVHREVDFWHSHEGVRTFIDNMINSLGNINQATATDYVRIAYGHIALDYIASKLKRQYKCNYNQLDWDEVYRRAWQYYRRKGYRRKYYRELSY